MYRKEKRIPTIIAILFLLLGIGGVVYLEKSPTSLISRATPAQQPADVHFTNITDNSFTISWLTTEPTVGAVVATGNSEKFTYLDDLDSDNIQRPRKTHFITVKNLKENTSYTIKIITGGNRCIIDKFCPTYAQKTAPAHDTRIDFPPAHGTITTSQDKPADGAIVYLVAPKSLPLSGLVDSSGLWVIPFNNLRSQDLSKVPELSESDVVQITTVLSLTENTTALIDIKSIKQNLTIPTMMIGKSYNFIDLESKKNIIAPTVTPNILGTISVKLDILFPKKDGDTTPDGNPRLRGLGKPGSQLLITVNSSPQTAKVTIAKDGTWVWRPPKRLDPGIHHISISGYDEKGNLVTIKRRFIVLKSGESVLGESTPSGTLTPTTTTSPSPTLALSSPTPSLTVSPTLIPSPTTIVTLPTSEPPRSGSNKPTLILLGAGLAILAAGLKFLIFK